MAMIRSQKKPTNAEIQAAHDDYVPRFYDGEYERCELLLRRLDGLPCYYKYTMNNKNNIHCLASDHEHKCPICKLRNAAMEE